jgi:hypothetical protein
VLTACRGRQRCGRPSTPPTATRPGLPAPDNSDALDDALRLAFSGDWADRAHYDIGGALAQAAFRFGQVPFERVGEREAGVPSPRGTRHGEDPAYPSDRGGPS